MNQTPVKHYRKPLWTVIALLLLFIGPIIAARLLFYSGYHSSKTTNHGVLINPPLSLQPFLSEKQAAALKGHWLILSVTPQTCGQTCQDNLYKIRQIHTALDKESIRVQRVWVNNANYPLSSTLKKALETTYKGTMAITVTPEEIAQLTANLAQKVPMFDKEALYVVDPLCRVILFYKAEASPRDIYADVTRLLKYSGVA